MQKVGLALTHLGVTGQPPASQPRGHHIRLQPFQLPQFAGSARQVARADQAKHKAQARAREVGLPQRLPRSVNGVVVGLRGELRPDQVVQKMEPGRVARAQAQRLQNLRAVQLLLGHSKLESTVRYLGIEVDDALEISEQTEI